MLINETRKRILPAGNSLMTFSNRTMFTRESKRDSESNIDSKHMIERERERERKRVENSAHSLDSAGYRGPLEELVLETLVSVVESFEPLDTNLFI